MAKANVDIRNEAKEAKVHHWQIARHLGCSESTFCRKLREELSLEDKAKVRQAITALGATKQGGGNDASILKVLGM